MSDLLPLPRFSLLGAIKDMSKSGSRLDASIVTTFAFNGVFYEDVLLRSFQRAGSRLNIVLADARQLSEAMSDDLRRPRRAGRDYILCPVAHPKAFHPKIVALLSEKAPALAIGSHNATTAGFGHNEEMTAFWGGTPAPPRSVLEACVEYALNWLARANTLPTSGFEEVAARLRELVRKTPEGDAQGMTLALDGDRSLMQQLADCNVGKVRRAIVIGPYFDSEFALVQLLQRTFDPREIVLAIDAKTALLGDLARLPGNARFVDVAALTHAAKRRGDPGFLHAKAIVLEGLGGRVVTIGSANPTMAAWALGVNGNAEANLILDGARASEAFAQLGLSLLETAAAIAPDVLAEASARSSAQRVQEGLRDEAKVHVPILQGRLIDGRAEVDANVAFDGWRLCAADGTDWPHSATVEPREGGFAVRSDELATGLYGVRRDAALVAFLIVHDERDLRAATMSRGGAQLLSGLGRIDQYGGFEEVFDLFSRLVVDTEPPPRPAVAASGGASTEAEAPPPSDVDAPFGPRGVSLADERLERTRKRLLEHGLVADLIAALIASLYVVPTPRTDGDAPELDAEDAEDGEPSADDLAKNSDAAADDIVPADVDWPRLVRVCRQRVGVMIGRLQRKLASIKPDAQWELGRLLAVLCLVQKLRMLPPAPGAHFEGAPQSLVSLEQLETLYRFAISHTYGKGRLGLRIAEVGGAGGFERSLLDNQLMWFAREVGADCARVAAFAEDDDVRNQRLQQRADLIVVSFSAAAGEGDEPWLMERADALARWSDARHASPDWYPRHRALGNALQARLENGAATDPAPLKSGGYALWKAEPGVPRVIRHLVGEKASLIEPGGDGADKKVMAAVLTGVELEGART